MSDENPIVSVYAVPEPSIVAYYMVRSLDPDPVNTTDNVEMTFSSDRDEIIWLRHKLDQSMEIIQRLTEALKRHMDK